MNRTDRLYAIVEELRAVSPRPRSARWLADRFEVSARTVERDVSALQQANTPIWAEPGRSGGYCLDRERTLPPINLTPQEAVAMTVALEGTAGTPFRAAAQTALRKLVTAMHSSDVTAAEALAARVHLIGMTEAPPPIPALIADALSSGHVLRIGYQDRDGTVTSRDVEPLGYVGSATNWYLIGWCRLRDGVRVFRTDRIISSAVTAEVPEPRVLRPDDLDVPLGDMRQLKWL